jgi:hypothetical protein
MASACLLNNSKIFGGRPESESEEDKEGELNDIS